MNLENIIAISGKPGLFKVMGQTKNGIVVESLLDGKRVPAYATDRISALEDISIYTVSEDVPLAEVFTKMFKLLKGGEALSHSSKGPELKKFFTEFLPDYDEDRVYTSDIKKVVRWYNELHGAKLLILEEEKKEEKKETAKKKPAAKKKATDKKETEKKPAVKAKKAPAKKKVEA